MNVHSDRIRRTAAISLCAVLALFLFLRSEDSTPEDVTRMSSRAASDSAGVSNASTPSEVERVPLKADSGQEDSELVNREESVAANCVLTGTLYTDDGQLVYPGQIAIGLMTAQTNRQGVFKMTNLRPGTHEVLFENLDATYLTRSVIGAVELGAGEVTHEDFFLPTRSLTGVLLVESRSPSHGDSGVRIELVPENSQMTQPGRAEVMLVPLATRLKNARKDVEEVDSERKKDRVRSTLSRLESIADLTQADDPEHAGAPFMLYHLLPGYYELRVDLGTIQLAGDGPSATIDVRLPIDLTQESVEGIVVKIDRDREIKRIVAELQKD